MRWMRVVGAAVLGLGMATAPAAAQTIGFKVGPTFSKADSNEGGEEAIESLGGGGFIRFGFAGLALQLEVLALTKGAAATFVDDGGTELEGQFKMDYIEIPLTAMFRLPVGPYLFAGPAVAIETGCDVELSFDDSTFETGCDSPDAEFPRKKTDFSLVGGAGFEFPVGPGRILVEGRYIYGLNNIADDDADPSAEFKHRTWAVFAGFAIPIGGLR